jgi:hypothetical protein
MSTPEVITVNSEALEATVRDLLPSQNGFGSELQASNVIMPIIDLTATAEGSGLSEMLQTAITFGNATAFEANNATATLSSTPGFYRITAGSTIFSNSGTQVGNLFNITDGSTTKAIWQHKMIDANVPQQGDLQFDFVVYLQAGETLTAVSNNANCIVAGSIRQIATVTGELVNPAGFVAE